MASVLSVLEFNFFFKVEAFREHAFTFSIKLLWRATNGSDLDHQP